MKHEEKVIITPKIFPTDTPEESEIEPMDTEKSRNMVRDHFAERNKKPLPEEEKIIITPHARQEKEVEETNEEEPHERETRAKVKDQFPDREKLPKEEEEKIIIKPYDMDKDKPEKDIDTIEKKKVSREDLKGALDVKIDSLLPTPDATVKRKKKKDPLPEDEIKNPLFDGVNVKSGINKRGKVKDHFPEK